MQDNVIIHLRFSSLRKLQTGNCREDIGVGSKLKGETRAREKIKGEEMRAEKEVFAAALETAAC